MIVGIGTDLVEVDRVEKIFEQRGERFASHVLHEKEMPAYNESKFKARMLAKRFAIKEAATKALGTGQAQNVLLRHFYVLHNEHGKPELFADSEAQVLCKQKGINALHVSVTDEGAYAAAYVILEKV